MTSDPGREIEVRDELLELLYWLEGEGFHEHASLGGLTRFLARPEDVVREALARLVARGDVMQMGGGTHRLTDIGRREAAHRFAEEFAPLMKVGHGECSDPDCDCHANPDGAADCHAARHQTRHPNA